MIMRWGWTRDRNSLSIMSLNDPSVVELKSKRKILKSIWNTTVYNEKKSKEQQGNKREGRKRIACMRTMTATITETGYRACGVVGCGMTVIQGAE